MYALDPTSADLDEPAGFIDRVIGGDVGSAGVDELIAEIQQDAEPDGEGRDSGPSDPAER